MGAPVAYRDYHASHFRCQILQIVLTIVLFKHDCLAILRQCRGVARELTILLMELRFDVEDFLRVDCVGRHRPEV